VASVAPGDYPAERAEKGLAGVEIRAKDGLEPVIGGLGLAIGN
jgi:hypothetical protein